MNTQRSIEKPRDIGQRSHAGLELRKRVALEFPIHAREQFGPHLMTGVGRQSVAALRISLALLKPEIGRNKLGRTPALAQPMHVEDQLLGCGQSLSLIERWFKVER